MKNIVFTMLFSLVSLFGFNLNLSAQEEEALIALLLKKLLLQQEKELNQFRMFLLQFQH